MADPTGQSAEGLWPQPNIQPTQSFSQMTAGLFAPSMDVVALQQNMVMNRQMLSMQQAVQNSMQIQAYAQGMPGFSSPSVTMGLAGQDPTVANYMLQNMYQMNPYMSNFLSQSGGRGPVMNMAPVEYMTNPRLGVFRQNQPYSYHGPVSKGMFTRDMFTLSDVWATKYLPKWVGSDVASAAYGFRGYAPYENPLEERMAAQRRMSQRWESFVGTGISLAPAAAAFIPGVGLPLAIGLEGVGMAAGAVTNAYFQRRAETNRIQELSQNLLVGANAGGLLNRGFSLGESSKMMSEFRKFSAASPQYTMADMMQVLEGGVDSGLFKIGASPQNTMRQVKEIVKNLDVFMMLAGDPDVKSAMDRMGRLQSLGLNVSQMQSAVTSLRAYARFAGTSVDNLMNGAGAYGAQIAVQQGVSGAFGMMMGAMNAAGARGFEQSGMVNAEDLSFFGGREGVAQAGTQAMISKITSIMTPRVAAFLEEKDGKLTLNRDLMDEYARKGTIRGQKVGNLLSYSESKYQGFSNTARDFFAANADKLINSAVANVKDYRSSRAFLETELNELRRLNPGISEDALYKVAYGTQKDYFKYFLSDKMAEDQLSQQSAAEAESEAKVRARILSNDQLTTRVGTWGKSLMNSLTETLDFESRALSEQEKALQSSSMPFIRGASSGRITDRETVSSLSILGTSHIGKMTDTQITNSLKLRDDVANFVGWTGVTGSRFSSGSRDDQFMKIYQLSQKNLSLDEFVASQEGQEKIAKAARSVSPDALRAKMNQYVGTGMLGGGDAKQFDFEGFFGESKENQALIRTYVSKFGSEGQKSTFLQAEQILRSAENAAREATLDRAKDSFDTASAGLGLKASQADAVAKFAGDVAKLSGTNTVNVNQVQSFAADLMKQNTALSQNQIMQMAQSKGLTIGESGAQQISDSISTLMSSGISKDRLAGASESTIQNMITSAANLSAVRQSYMDLSFNRPGFLADESAIKRMAHDPSWEAYRKKHWGSVSGAEIESRISRISEISKEGISTNAHGDDMSQLFQAMVFKLSELVMYARENATSGVK